MSGDRGHHPVSLPEIKPWHQGSKITQRWTPKSPRPAQARPPPATARDCGRRGPHPPQGPQGQLIPANWIWRAAQDLGQGIWNGVQGSC